MLLQSGSADTLIRRQNVLSETKARNIVNEAPQSSGIILRLLNCSQDD